MPFTFFCHQGSPEEARTFLEGNGAVVEGDDEKWTASVATGGGFLKRRKALRFTYDLEWCSPPNWPIQLNGMTNYVLQFEMKSELRRQVLVLIPRFEYSIGIVLDPDETDSDDERLGIIQAVASHLGCVVFTPGALLDPNLRAFADANGGVDDEAEIPWGRKGPPAAAELAKGEDESNVDEEDDDSGDEPPTPERVARRLYALVAIAARGLYDMNAGEGRTPAYSLDELRNWTKALALGDEFEPKEHELLATKALGLARQDIVNSVWGIEGAVMLAWALGLVPWPVYDEEVSVDEFLHAVGFLDVERSPKIVSAPSLRTPSDLERCNRQMLAYHWRMVDFRVEPRTVRFDQVAIFGEPFDTSWAKLHAGDLTLKGTPISAADPGLAGHCESISFERFRASNWLVGYDPIYSETPTDT